MEVHVLHDPLNPKIQKGELFPDIISFRKAIRHYAVVKGFELAPGVRTDKTRFIARCAASGCPWRIHASTIFDKKTVQIKTLPAEHNCPTTKLREGKMASQGWCADMLGDWVKKNPTKGGKDAREKLEGDFGIKLKYSKAWSGLQQALNQIHGKYEESFQLLFNWAAQIELSSPGSRVHIELEKIGKKNRFKRVFVALKPCIDGFLAGCRPFIGVDASCLNGKYTGQLASATGVDGHNWLYHIAYAVFDSETEDNWKWFLENLHTVIGDPPGLVLCSDACKGLEKAVGAVFPRAENRECMRHMYQNFMKHYSGDVFTDHLYPAAKSYTEGLFKWHMNCREWQITGKPCKHALAWILSNRGIQIADYVHEYYSVARFRAAYEGRVEPMPDRTQWPEFQLGFKVHPPLLGRGAGRPKKVRIRGCLEKQANKKKVRCKRCRGFGHFSKTCKLEMVGEDGETARTNKRKRQDEVDTAGPSKKALKKKATKKKSPKKKKTPLKKKQKKAAAAPAPKVVKSLKNLLSTVE